MMAARMEAERVQLIAQEYDRVTWICRERNRGKDAAIRAAIPFASGDIIVMHDTELWMMQISSTIR